MFSFSEIMPWFLADKLAFTFREKSHIQWYFTMCLWYANAHLLSSTLELMLSSE
jgi:hypothetical protein